MNHPDAWTGLLYMTCSCGCCSAARLLSCESRLVAPQTAPWLGWAHCHERRTSETSSLFPSSLNLISVISLNLSLQILLVRAPVKSRTHWGACPRWWRSFWHFRLILITSYMFFCYLLIKCVLWLYQAVRRTVRAVRCLHWCFKHCRALLPQRVWLQTESW